MSRSDISLTVALCASLALHAAISYALSEQYVRTVGGNIFLPPLPRAVVVDDSPQPIPLPTFDPEEDPFNRLGDATGTGYAIDESPGERQLLARLGKQDQPFLSRDPIGPGRVGDEPSESLVSPGDGAIPERPRSAPVSAMMAETATTVVGIPLPQASALPEWIERREDAAAQPQAVARVRPEELATVPPSVPSAPRAPQPVEGRPGPPIPAADPAPQGESEIDPFSIIGTAEFRRGFTKVQLGRKHKLTRPRLTLGALVELVSIGETQIILKLRTDSAGNVLSAEVQRSSGSASTDQIFRVTAYEWWFDPPTDSAGTPTPDAFLFPIRIY